jgi:hypothetical protein
VLADPDRHRLAAVWAVALLAAVPWRTRAASAARLAVASLGLAVAAQAAAAVSRQRTDDRDAVRLLGRSAVRAPGWQLARASASWGPEPLGWGPLYEPHRHPAGAEIGRRLALAPGHYRLRLDAQDLAGQAPTLLVAPDSPGAPVRASPLSPASDGWEGSFAVLPGEQAVTLLLKGGGPLLLRHLALEVQPPAEAPV